MRNTGSEDPVRNATHTADVERRQAQAKVADLRAAMKDRRSI